MAPPSTNLASFLKSVETINKDSFSDDKERHQAYLAIRKLANRLETPYETFLRRGWDEPCLDSCLKIGHDINLYEALAADNGKAKSVESLATATNSKAPMLRRVCKHLASMEVIHEAGEDIYQPTEYSNSLLNPGLRAVIPCLFNGYALAIRALPQWLKENDYATPTSVRDCPQQTHTGDNSTFWEWHNQDSQRLEDFHQIMLGKDSGWKSAMDLYPVQERLVKGSKGGILMVDVGGGWGQDLKRLYQRLGDAKDVKMILQDQAQVLSEAKVEDFPIETMIHDFFTEQPVKGPRSFFMKQICHDWPDDQVINILSHLKEAMEPGYTKLLIHDLVIPPTQATPYATALDLTMCSAFGASERTRADWDRVFEGVGGLVVEKVYSAPGYYESVLELVRKK